jgi:hypothetical protein
MTATERAMAREEWDRIAELEDRVVIDDALLGTLRDRIRDLRVENGRLRTLGQMALGMLEAIWTGAMDGVAPNPEALRERIDWYAAEFAPATDEEDR